MQSKMTMLSALCCELSGVQFVCKPLNLECIQCFSQILLFINTWAVQKSCVLDVCLCTLTFTILIHLRARRHLASRSLVDKHTRAGRHTPVLLRQCDERPLRWVTGAAVWSCPVLAAVHSTFTMSDITDPCAPPGWEKAKREIDRTQRWRFACKSPVEARIATLWSLKSARRLK